MTHFTVLVIGENPEEQLAPYQENNMGNCPTEYLAFEDVQDEYEAEYATKTVPQVFMPDGRVLFPWDEAFKAPDRAGDEDLQIAVLGGVKRDVPLSTVYPTFEAFMRDHVGFSQPDPTTGRYGHWANPNARWDWFVLGGRWTGFFKLKPDATGSTGSPGIMTDPAPAGCVDQAQMCAIDFEGMRQDAADRAGEQYDMVVRAFGGTIPKLDRRWSDLKDGLRTREQVDEARILYAAQPAMLQLQALRARIRTAAVRGVEVENKVRDLITWLDLEAYQCSREDYMAQAARTRGVTHAVIKDGQWYERGTMGWWGVVHNEQDEGTWDLKYTELLASLPPDTLLSVFDCHI